MPYLLSTSLKRKCDSSLCDSGSNKYADSGSVPRIARSRKNAAIGTRKERKRAQNKKAALRYRKKKREAKVEVGDQQSILEEENAKLKSMVSSLDAEISYLKKLWAEVEHAREMQPQLAPQI